MPTRRSQVRLPHEKGEGTVRYILWVRNQYDLAHMSLLEELLLRENDPAQGMDAGYNGFYLAQFDIANKVAN